MANFRYRGRGNRGDLMEGALEATSADAAAAQLINSGITPIDIREFRPSANGWEDLRERLQAGPPDLAELILLSRQMYTLMRAGVPLAQGLNGLGRSTRNPTLRKAMENIKSTIESGRELSAAMALIQTVMVFIAVAIMFWVAKRASGAHE